MGQLRSHDRSAVRAITGELAIYRPDGASTVPGVMTAIHELVGSSTAALFSLAEAERGLALTRCHLVGFPARFDRLFSTFFSSAPRRYGLYDAARPEPHHRNRVVLASEEASREDRERHPYPIVQVTNRATGHVQYSRTHGFSNFSIARGAHSSALLDIPSTFETGTSDLVVIANGVASDPVRVKIK